MKPSEREHVRHFLHKGDVTRDDFWRNTAFNIVAKLHVSNSYNIVRALQRCVALKIVVANRPVYGVYTMNRTSHRL